MNELQNLEQLLNELINGIGEILQSGEILSDEFQGTIAQELEFLTNRIDELKAAETPEVPLVDPAPFASAVVNGFKYNPKSGDLFVKFQDKFPGTNGSQYVYKGIPPFIAQLFSRGAVSPKTSGSNAWHTWKKSISPSLGASLNALLKQGGYAFQKLT